MAGFLDKLSTELAMDLGSQNSRVWVRGKGLQGQYPSCLAIDTTNNKVLAWGQDAVELAGRAASNVVVHHPIRNGEAWDEKALRAYLRFLLEEALAKTFLSPVVHVSVSSRVSPAVRTVIETVLKELGAREVVFQQQLLMAAIGAGMPVADPSGGFLVQLGEGVIEAGVISLGKVVAVESEVWAGQECSQLVQQLVTENFGVEIGSVEAEKLMATVLSFTATTQSALITGKDQQTAAPREIEVFSKDLKEGTEEFGQKVVSLVKRLLTKLPAELTVDVVDKGVLLSGGLAQAHGLDVFLVKELGVPVSVIEEPDLAVIQGMGAVMEQGE